MVLDAGGFGGLEAPDFCAGLFDEVLHGAAGEVAGFAGAVAAEDEEFGDASGEEGAEFGVGAVGSFPSGVDPAVAPGVFDHAGDGFFAFAVDGENLVLGGEEALVFVDDAKCAVRVAMLDDDLGDDGVLGLGDHSAE